MRIGGVEISWYELSILIVASLLLCIVAPAQTTSVTATITDPDAQTWNNGTWSASLYNPFPANPPSINGVPLTTSQLNLSGSINGSGVLTGTFSDNSFIAPTGTQWYITLCPNASTQCVTGLTAITGSSANLSTLFSSYTKAIRIPAASVNVYAYQDLEIYPIPVPGGRYWRVTDNTQRCWTGSSWIQCGGGGGGSGCTLSSLPNNSVIYTPDGTSCSGDGNFSYFPGDGRIGTVLINGAQDGTETRLIIEAQHDNTGGVGSNNTVFRGHDIAVSFDGGGEDIDPALSGIDVEGNDANYSGDIATVMSGVFSILAVDDAGRNAIGVESGIDMFSGSGKAGTLQGFQADDIPNVQATNFYGYRAKLLGADATGDDFAFFADDVARANMNSNFCDILTRTSDLVQRLSLGCGPDATSDFYGLTTIHAEEDIAGTSGVAGGSAMQQGTSPNSGAPPTGYVGWTAPTTVTNNYWAPMPGTFPGSIVQFLGCAGTSSPLSCNWESVSGLASGTPTFTPAAAATAVCATGYVCTNTRGEIDVELPSGTIIGTVVTVTFSTTLTSAPFCAVIQNQNTTTTTLGHSAPSTTSFNVITPAILSSPDSFFVDYSCQP